MGDDDMGGDSPQLPTESGVERAVLTWLRDVPMSLQWDVYGLKGGEGAARLDREYERNNGEVIYWDLLEEQLVRINDEIHENNVGDLITSLKTDIGGEGLMADNRAFHQLLRRGKQFDVKHHNGTAKPTYVDLIDFEEPVNNSFVAVNQMRVTRGPSVRPDVTLLVNGLPLVHVELKSLAQDNDYTEAIADLKDYEAAVPRMFAPTLLNVAADTQAFRYGAVGAPAEWYAPWSEAPPEFEDDLELKQGVQALLNPGTLLDLLQHYVFYEQGAGWNKIVPRHMQYYATREILGRIRRGDSRRGLIWHTQGSGKSYTMLYTAKNLLERPQFLSNPQVLIVVDTEKLETQMADTLSAIDFERSTVAQSSDHLGELIERGRSQLVLTTIQKFQDAEPDAQGNPETVVLADEAHRFMERLLGSKLEGALPEAWHFGFTGTPVHEGDSPVARSTFDNYAPDDEGPLHRYSIRDGIDDDVILPVYFTLRHEAEWSIDAEGMDAEFEEKLADGGEQLTEEQALREALTPRDLGELEPRIETYADVVVDHYEEVERNGWKGMVVAPSRESAAMYGEKLVERRSAEEVEVLYTANEDDAERVGQFHTSSEERDRIVRAFKEEDEPKLLVVHNMLLTGFDAPVLKAMYLDRNLTDHNLLQAIARTNRPAEGKTNGEIVDFQGVFEHLDEALSYDAETRDFAARDRDELFETFEDQLDEVWGLFEGVPKTDDPEAVQEALAAVGKHPERRDFKQGYRRLEDLYESVSPDERLVRPEIEDRYQWLSRIWVAFRRANHRDEEPEKELREKTKAIVEKYVDVTRVKQDFPIYELGREHLEAIEDQQPAARANSIAHAVKAHLRPKTEQNPRYESLSERVEEILHRWQTDQMTDPDAVEALEQLELAVIDEEEAADEHGFDGAEHALYALLVDDYDQIGDESYARALAREMRERLDREIDTSFDGWERNEQTLKNIEQELMRTLIDEDELDAVKEGFAQEAVDYVVANDADCSR